MSKHPLNDAQRDSHKVTCGLHLATAHRLASEGNFIAAKTALELAWPHANAIGNKELKSKVFAALNTVRAAIRKSSKHDSADAKPHDPAPHMPIGLID